MRLIICILCSEFYEVCICNSMTINLIWFDLIWTCFRFQLKRIQLTDELWVAMVGRVGLYLIVTTCYGDVQWHASAVIQRLKTYIDAYNRGQNFPWFAFYVLYACISTEKRYWHGNCENDIHFSVGVISGSSVDKNLQLYLHNS